jgi:hypothetical protein
MYVCSLATYSYVRNRYTNETIQKSSIFVISFQESKLHFGRKVFGQIYILQNGSIQKLFANIYLTMVDTMIVYTGTKNR